MDGEEKEEERGHKAIVEERDRYVAAGEKRR